MPRESALTQWPSIMPQTGSITCASHHGVGLSTSVEHTRKETVSPATIDTKNCSHIRG